MTIGDRAFLALATCGVVFWASPGIAAENPILVSPSASYSHTNDGGYGGPPMAAMHDGKEPSSSNDHKIPRFTFWSHRGTAEWVQFDLDRPTEVSSIAVYWFDDRPGGGCRVPASWKVFCETAYTWMPVRANGPYDTERDQYNRVDFEPIVTNAIRIEVQQQPDWSGGIFECRINDKTHKLGELGSIGGEGAPHVSFDYPKTRLIVAALIAAFGSDEPEAAGPLAQLDAAATDLFSARAGMGLGDRQSARRWGAAAERLAALEEQFAAKPILQRLDERSPESRLELMIRLDWLAQDCREQPAVSFLTLAHAAVNELESTDGAKLARELAQLSDANGSATDPRWMDLYLRACDQRRVERMGESVSKFPRIVFARHHDIGGQHYAYTEDVSDSPYNDNNPFPPSGQLCLLEMDGVYARERVLIDEPNGLIRDPAVSYDGKRILFAWRHSMTEDDYHLYEMNVGDESIRQLTFGQGVADYEATYLPGGDILFNSSRCQQIVDCWWADVSNLYTCDGDGRYLRRLSYDQVHTNYPQVLPDGRVIYTRWDYNDRGQLFPQPLFEMNPDGTSQRGYYGNSSWFPTTILHSRGIPNSGKIVCVLSGHHTYQKGKLAIIDPSKGREENSGTQLIAPVRETEAVRIDKYGYQGEQFQYPWALSETEFLVTYSTEGSLQGRSASEKPFGIYFFTIDGRRELLSATPTISSSQPVPVLPRPEPGIRPSRVDYRKSLGTYVLHDVYAGDGLQGVARGTIKRLRVVALEFRAAGVGSNQNNGPAGGALVSTPISINGAWDVKRVLGTTEVYADGSAAFTVPARTPVYFQALDTNGHAVQSMRSWSTLQPGETFSCVGCHDDKNTSPPTSRAATMAMRAGPQPLEPLGDPTLGFSFARMVQPILDTHCVECHNRETVADGSGVISLEATGTLDKRAQKLWSDAYTSLADRKYVRWVSPQSAPPVLAPYSDGAANSRLIEMLTSGHEDVKLSEDEMARISCWIDLAVPFTGTYTEAMPEDRVAEYMRYQQKRDHWAAEDERGIQALLDARAEGP